MRQNVLAFVQLVAEVHQTGPVVEFGSFQIQEMANLRRLWPECEYTGTDVREGPGVDVVADCTNTGFESESAGTIIACDVIEHVERCWELPHEAFRLLSAAGVFVMSAPFYFPIHHVPDYWRFTPECIDKLLSPFPYRTVYHQGDLSLPHSVLAFASKSEDVYLKLSEHMTANIHRLPAMIENESIYEWRGQDLYQKTWYNTMAGKHSEFVF